MGEFFNNRVKTALQVAYNFELAKELDTAKDMYARIIKSVAKHNRVDLMTYFYGDNVYDKIENFEDAIICVFIAGCAHDAYLAIEPLGSVTGSSKSWALEKSEETDDDMYKALSWLGKRDRRVEEEDSKIFKILIKKAKNNSKTKFVMADKFKTMKLTEIIPLIVSGSCTVTEDGELT